MTTNRTPFAYGRHTAGLLAVLLFASTVGLAADVPGRIWKVGDDRPIAGLLRYLPASKVYVITGKNNMQMNLPLAQVAKVDVPAPVELDNAAKMINAGQFAQAIPILQKIAEDYKMLQWDVRATMYLAIAKLRSGAPADAVKLCEQIVRDNPQAAFSSDLAPVYWDALLQSDQTATLERLLGKAAEMGNRELAALAQLKRGDILQKKGNLKEALVDGYLRTVIVYQAIESVQPEALYKAAKCFEELGQTTHAEKMRKRLLAKYPQSEWAQKMKAGA